MRNIIKPIAYYLPQYHPIPENDKWWGKGFTEWTNVTKASPLFKNHYQPRYPADLGYYDLRLAEIREAQANLAKENGIYGFCYYHYWFGDGKQLLERPFNEVLEKGKPDFPFMLCWANQTWKGVWFGEGEGKTLIQQSYPGIEDYENHFKFLVKAFKDKRYITINEKPVFQVYMPMDIPDLPQFVLVFRKLAVDYGLNGIYLMACNVQISWNPHDHGFDGVVSSLFHTFRFKEKNTIFKQGTLMGKVEYKWKKFIEGKPIESRRKPKIYNYQDVVNLISQWPNKDYDYFPMVIPDWDNSARAGHKSMILKGSTPEKWKNQVEKALNYANSSKASEKLIFIKSWNEWAEGNYLEPDKKWGKSYLEVIKKILK